MWAICGSVGFAAPCASASPVPITSADSAAPNLNASMVLSSEREPKSIRTPLDARRRERFPEFRDNAVGHALAAQVAERKGLAERRAEPFHDRGAEQHAGAEEPGFHRLGLEAEDLRGFLDAHLLEQTSDDDPAKRRRQLVDRLLQHVPELVVGHRPLGVGGGNGITWSGRSRRSRSSAALTTMRPSQVLRLDSPRKPPISRKARRYASCTASSASWSETMLRARRNSVWFCNRTIVRIAVSSPLLAP